MKKLLKNAVLEAIWRVPVLREAIGLRRAEIAVVHRNANGDVLGVEKQHNLILNVGRVQYHKQCFGTSGLSANGMNYIALSNDATAPAATDTTLTAEIAANGLSRAQGTVTLPTGSGNQTTVDKTFTATGAQACQKAALFDASSAGNMNHELLFTQRSLQTNDTIQVTYTLTLGLYILLTLLSYGSVAFGT
jgi:hypothetical protein